VNSRQILSAALALLDDGRAHAAPPQGTKGHAFDAGGLKVRPRDVRAVAWSSVGALCFVAPAASASDDTVYADHTWDAWNAFLALEDAARLQGFANSVELDRAGYAKTYQAFQHAMNQCEPKPRRRQHRVGTGPNPRGVEAV
jgi:hypothetical protein